MYAGNGGWGELAISPIDSSYQDPVTSVAFDGLYEVVWAGSASGRLLTFSSPDLSVSSYWPGHVQPVISLTPLPGSDLVLSLARDAALLCNSGGIRRSGYVDKSYSLQCCCLEPGAAAARTAYLGDAQGTVMSMDLASGKTTTLASDFAGDGSGVVCLKGNSSKSLLAVGTSTGKIYLADPRTSGLRINDTSTSASTTSSSAAAGVMGHPAGLTAIEVSKDGKLACCGLVNRGTHTVPEPFIKVFDIRGNLLRPLLTIPVSGPGGGPTCLTFHPLLPSLLMAGCARGVLAVADTGVGAVITSHQVETGGSALTSCAVSPTGEVWALADQMGCVRLWSETATPRVHSVMTAVEVPPATPPAPAVSLDLNDSFALATPPQLDTSSGSRLLSALDSHILMAVGQAPRQIDVALMTGVKQVDFVGHLSNPHYVRGEAFGAATAKVAALRNKRADMKAAISDKHHFQHLGPHDALSGAKAAGRTKKPSTNGQLSLPHRFEKVEIKAQSGVRFEEFDMSNYNKTRFAGLENDMPNAYANALIQVLYFTPEIRTSLLTDHVPEPDTEFCLTCELALLFRMMCTAHGKTCQAANLLRALRQIREAAALGLLDVCPTTHNTSSGGSTIGNLSNAPDNAHDAAAVSGATMSKDWSLGRRCAALSRFLLDTLAKESGSAKQGPTSHVLGGAQHALRSGIPQPAPGNATIAGVLDALFAIPVRQRLQVVQGPVDSDGARPSKMREGRVMQLDLQYPLCTSKAVKIASDVGRLGFNKLPQAAAAALGLSSANSLLTGGTGSAAITTTAQDKPAAAVPSIMMVATKATGKRAEAAAKGKSNNKDVGLPAAAGEPSSSDGPRTPHKQQAAAAAKSSSQGQLSDSSQEPCTPPHTTTTTSSSSTTTNTAPPSFPLNAPVTPGSPHTPATPRLPGVPGSPKAHAITLTPNNSILGTPVVLPGSSSAAHEPSFAELLESSFINAQDTRAWFDESRGYTKVHQDRLPTALPKALIISCPVTESSDLEWWRSDVRHVTASGAVERLEEVSKLPWALRVEVNQRDWSVRVRQGDCVASLALLPPDLSNSSSGDANTSANTPSNTPIQVVDACYELCAVIANVSPQASSSEDEGTIHRSHTTYYHGNSSSNSSSHTAGRTQQWAIPGVHASTTTGSSGGKQGQGMSGASMSSSGQKANEGHLVAMIKVPDVYIKELAPASTCTIPPIGAGKAESQPADVLPPRYTPHSQAPTNSTSSAFKISAPPVLLTPTSTAATTVQPKHRLPDPTSNPGAGEDVTKDGGVAQSSLSSMLLNNLAPVLHPTVKALRGLSGEPIASPVGLEDLTLTLTVTAPDIASSSLSSAGDGHVAALLATTDRRTGVDHAPRRYSNATTDGSLMAETGSERSFRLSLGGSSDVDDDNNEAGLMLQQQVISSQNTNESLPDLQPGPLGRNSRLHHSAGSALMMASVAASGNASAAGPSSGSSAGSSSSDAAAGGAINTAGQDKAAPEQPASCGGAACDTSSTAQPGSTGTSSLMAALQQTVHPAVQEGVKKVQEGWLLFNDFAVSPVSGKEVLCTYGGRKLPCVLHYRRVDTPIPLQPPEVGSADQEVHTSSSTGNVSSSSSSAGVGVTVCGDREQPASPEDYGPTPAEAAIIGKHVPSLCVPSNSRPSTPTAGNAAAAAATSGALLSSLAASTGSPMVATQPCVNNSSGAVAVAGNTPGGAGCANAWAARMVVAATQKGGHETIPLPGSTGSAAAGGGVSASHRPAPPRIRPVLTAHEFGQLCRAPPLQGNLSHLGPPRFKALDMITESPRPGMILALDAEFVMVSNHDGAAALIPPDASLEVKARHSRLTLGRVSVLRGEGPAAGSPCVDDYVRVVEPVVDYLTRYSGLAPGDLEPSTSRHYLTTMKHAYLKLRYLVDCGCVFVGHGLKKDLRIINITVPPQQIVDTVELFSKYRQRKMSLRFLASYLLDTHIQCSVHDSIEDARTALRLYELYKQLVAQGTFQAKLEELYAWGARYGWEPVTLDANGTPIPPAVQQLQVPPM